MGTAYGGSAENRKFGIPYLGGRRHLSSLLKKPDHDCLPGAKGLAPSKFLSISISPGGRQSLAAAMGAFFNGLLAAPRAARQTAGWQEIENRRVPLQASMIWLRMA
jgi:hypothetical protein